MKTYISLLLAFSLIAPSLANSEQLPTNIDLRAAFCLSWYNEGSSMMAQSEKSARGTVYEEDVRKSLAEALAKHERLRSYLLPRVSYLEPTGLLAAAASGKDAASRQTNTIKNCFPKCEKEAAPFPCLKSCTANANEETEQCRNLSWLPY